MNEGKKVMIRMVNKVKKYIVEDNESSSERKTKKEAAKKRHRERKRQAIPYIYQDLVTK